MKKLVVASFIIFASQNVFGIYSAWVRSECARNLIHKPVQPSNEAELGSTSATNSESAGIDTLTKEKIRNFSLNLKSQFYNAKQIEKALTEYVCMKDRTIENISELNAISTRTLQRWISTLGINSRNDYRSKKSITTEKNIINTLQQDIEWKNFHNIIGKKRNATINTLRKLQEKGQFVTALNENEKVAIIEDYRKKLLTHKGIARKHNIKESDLYCVIHEARKNGKDLTLIKQLWEIIYKKRQFIPQKQKERIVSDYNKGLLTLQGICVKYGVTQKIVQHLIYRDYRNELKKRNGQRLNEEELVSDLQNRTTREIERKYGYKSVYIDELRIPINQWNLLTADQKRLFYNTMINGTLPSKDTLSSIQNSSNRKVNEKFKKLLFVSVSTCEDIMAEFGISKNSIPSLRRQLGVWKILTREWIRKSPKDI